jgi:hypothetical protein
MFRFQTRFSTSIPTLGNKTEYRKTKEEEEDEVEGNEKEEEEEKARGRNEKEEEEEEETYENCNRFPIFEFQFRSQFDEKFCNGRKFKSGGN